MASLNGGMEKPMKGMDYVMAVRTAATIRLVRRGERGTQGISFSPVLTPSFNRNGCIRDLRFNEIYEKLNKFV